MMGDTRFDTSRRASDGNNYMTGNTSGETGGRHSPFAHRKRMLWFLEMTLTATLLILGLTAILNFSIAPRELDIAVGEVAPRDVPAPRRISYESALLTQAERDRAAAAVKDVYTAPDPSITRAQVARAQEIVAYIESVRYDDYASPEVKAHWVAAIPDLTLSTGTISTVISLDESAWQRVAAEVYNVLEQMFRSDIREGRLNEARTQVPRLVSYALPADQANVVAEIARDLLVPNSFLDAEETEALRQQARTSVAPVQHTMEHGEIVVRSGDVVTALDIEELEALGLLRSQHEWQKVVGTFLFVTSLVLVLLIYIYRFRPEMLTSRRQRVLLALTILSSLILAKSMIPGHVVLPYIFPMAAISMLLALLFDIPVALIVTTMLSFTVGVIGGNSLELSVYTLLGGLVGAFSVYRVERLGEFLWAAGYVALANVVVALAFRLYNQNYDPIGLLQLAGAGVFNSALSTSLAFATFSALGRVFGITTSLQLLEMARPTHPLLRQLLLGAPGTYHHSIIVGNLAERAAELVGADGLLARVGAYYHDIGKIKCPYFFAENQVDGQSYHERLDAKTSAQIIINHVSDGVELGRKYGLPDRVLDIIAEHHGTSAVSYGYFYHKAMEERDSQTVDESDFHYAGPRPQTKEAAIVMLADSAEAAVRAARPSSPSEIEHTVRTIISDRLVAGELDKCNLTLRDLDSIRAAFIDLLVGIFHPRIQYPASTTGTRKSDKGAQ